MKVKDYMKTDPVAIAQDKTLADAVKKMVEEKTNSLVIVKDLKSMRPVGVFSNLRLIKEVLPDYLEDDPYVSDFESEGELTCFSVQSRNKKLKNIMFKLKGKLDIRIHPEDAMVRAASYASKKSVRTLPVVDENNKLVGIVDRTCIKNAIYDSLFKSQSQSSNCDFENSCGPKTDN